MKVKLSMNSIFYFLLIFLFIPPKIISLFPTLRMFNRFITYGGIAIAIIIIIFFILGNRKKEIKYHWIIMTSFVAWLFISNLINQTIGQTFIIQMSFCIAMLLIIEYVFNKNMHVEFLRVFSFYCVIVVTLNTLSQIWYGVDGIYHDWSQSWQAYFVCGNSNSFVFFYLLTVGVTSAYASYNKKYAIYSYIIHLVMVYSMFYTLSIDGSTTGVLIITVLFFFRIISIDKVKSFVFKNYKMMLLIFTTFGVWVILFNGWRSEWIINLLNIYLNENASFFNRGIIWSNTIQKINSAPLFGYGTDSIFIANDYDGIIRSAHNNYLEIAVLGGIPSIILYIVFILNCLKKHGKNKASYMPFIVVIFYLIAYLVEQNPFNIGFYCMLILYKLITEKEIDERV